MATERATLTFTPKARGKLIILVDFEAQGIDGGDWGASTIVKPFIKQSGTDHFGNSQRVTTTRLKYTVQHIYQVEASASVDCGIEANCSGATAINCWNINIRAHLVKETST